jgi:hypothetical protein
MGARGTQAQEAAFRTFDFQEVELQFSVPENWVHSGLVTKTKSEFIREFGRVYEQPDSAEVWSAFTSFNRVEVDSSLVPSDSAYSIHFLTIFVQRSRTLYRQWLCWHDRRSLWEGNEQRTPESRVISEKRLRGGRSVPPIIGVYAKEYELATERVEVSTLGHVTSFVHEEKCYRIKLESTSVDTNQSAWLHDRILRTVRILD